VAVLASVFLALAVSGGFHESLTCDEPIFIASGYSYLVRNDFRMNSEAPPFLQVLVALPLAAMGAPFPPKEDPDWQEVNQGPFCTKVVFGSGIPIRKVAFWCRLPIALLSSGLILALYLWARNLYGPKPAILAPFLLAFSPNFMAHGRLATTDAGCATFMFVSVWFFWRSIRWNRIRDWVLLGFATGLALASKYTSLLLGPIYVVLLVGCILKDRSSFPWKSLVLRLTISTAVAFLIVGVSYNFSFRPSLYLRGMQQIYKTVTPDYSYYLWGKISDTPWKSYNILAFLIKTPLPILILLVAATVALARDDRHREAAFFLWVPIFVIVGVACFDRANLGLRRILPALPFLFVFCVQSIAIATDWKKPALAALLGVWLVWETVAINPFQLSYFNQLVGGPKNGLRFLDDSNIDWGQDLPELAAWQRRHPEAQPMRLLYFGTSWPEAYGVVCEPLLDSDIVKPRPGYYAVSAHCLIILKKVQRHQGGDMDWLAKYKPVDKVGTTFTIYEFPRSAEEAR